jgi:hypothetical protein
MKAAGGVKVIVRNPGSGNLSPAGFLLITTKQSSGLHIFVGKRLKYLPIRPHMLSRYV